MARKRTSTKAKVFKSRTSVSSQKGKTGSIVRNPQNAITTRSGLRTPVRRGIKQPGRQVKSVPGPY